MKTAHGWPISLVIASRSDGRIPLQPEKAIYLKNLAYQDAKELLETLLRGAALPESIKEDILKRSNGIPLHLEEMVRALIDQKIIEHHPEDSSWIFNSTTITQDYLLPSSIRAAMTSRLDQLNTFERDFLNQSSIQGIEFDLKILEILRKNPTHRGPAIQTLTPALERRNFIANDPQTPAYKLKFCHPLMQETCYQIQLHRDRQILHYETALALCELSGSETSAPQDLLSYHFENAQKWAEAARANLHCAHKARDLYLNEEAVQRYERTINQIQSLESGSEDQRNLLAEAFGNIAKIYLRTGQYDLAKASIEKMETLETHKAYRAEAKRLLAAIHYQTGKAVEARDRLEESLQMSKKYSHSTEVTIEILLDLASFYHHENQTQKAFQYLTECRSICQPQDNLSLIKMDILEGMLAHTEGKFSDATKLYTHAFEAAKQAGTLSEIARSSNHLGNVEHDQGHYVQARHHYEEALSLWQRMGEIEGVSGAHNNLGNIYMSLGEYEKARFHQENALEAGKKISNTRIIALAQSNLAILALEEEKNSEAVQFAEQALKTLGESGEWLRLLVLVVLGEGLLNAKKTTEAERILKEVLNKCNDSSHPLAFAGALRAMGRLSLILQNSREALNYLERAIAIFRKIKRTQEAARTEVLQAQALKMKGEKTQAREMLKQVLQEFEKIGADKDKERVLQLLQSYPS
jgi:tetratricopeptide (TPR) repeat protein